MKVYLSRSFQREAGRSGVSDEDCQIAVRRAEGGLVDADLGGGLIKQRIPRGNQGAARGARAIVFFRQGDVAVFLDIFAKSDKASLSRPELAEFRELAKGLNKLTPAKLQELSSRSGWRQLPI